MMNKETLSISQANKIIDETNIVLEKSVHKMEENFNRFLKELSLVWEDNNAVELAAKTDSSYQEIIRKCLILYAFFSIITIGTFKYPTWLDPGKIQFK